MLSATVSSGTSWPNWNTKPNSERRSSERLLSVSVSSRWPSSQTSPRGGARMPARQYSSVDFPEPLGPITATISPGATARLAPVRAGVRPKDQYTSRASIRLRAPLTCRGTGRRHDARTISASAPSLAEVTSIHRRSASRWKSP